MWGGVKEWRERDKWFSLWGGNKKVYTADGFLDFSNSFRCNYMRARRLIAHQAVKLPAIYNNVPRLYTPNASSNGNLPFCCTVFTFFYSPSFSFIWCHYCGIPLNLYCNRTHTLIASNQLAMIDEINRPSTHFEFGANLECFDSRELGFRRSDYCNLIESWNRPCEVGCFLLYHSPFSFQQNLIVTWCDEDGDVYQTIVLIFSYSFFRWSGQSYRNQPSIHNSTLASLSPSFLLFFLFILFLCFLLLLCCVLSLAFSSTRVHSLRHYTTRPSVYWSTALSL